MIEERVERDDEESATGSIKLTKNESRAFTSLGTYFINLYYVIIEIIQSLYTIDIADRYAF